MLCSDYSGKYGDKDMHEPKWICWIGRKIGSVHQDIMRDNNEVEEMVHIRKLKIKAKKREVKERKLEAKKQKQQEEWVENNKFDRCDILDLDED